MTQPGEPPPSDPRDLAARRGGDEILRKGFDPESLSPHFIAEPLASKIFEAPEGEAEPDLSRLHHIIIDLNSTYPGGRDAARNAVLVILAQLRTDFPLDPVSFRDDVASMRTLPYVFAHMSGSAIVKLATRIQPAEVAGPAQNPPIFRIWEDQEVAGFITQSVATVKADAAQIAFSASGKGIVWAVVDSGIDATHRHFKRFANLLDLPAPLRHRDFRLDDQGGPVADIELDADAATALEDDSGHGTHVAGIVGGAILTDVPPPTTYGGDDWQSEITVLLRRNDEKNQPAFVRDRPARISGMAPQCKLLSLRVLDAANMGRTSSVLQALEYVQSVNDYGRKIVVHGVNLSFGYNFNPEWYACGQSPLCVEVDRLVKSGVCVVVAAGNSGYGFMSTKFTRTWGQGIEMSINDPGNADLAITVGSTHREMPHTYGVSYFSSKGPTGDGRRKPDLLAPGERIISCAAGEQLRKLRRESKEVQFEFLEDSGTSMSAPHVSGIVAAFLSIRREYIGKPTDVKNILLSTATDLKREPNHQGAGLVDLMRAIQSV